MAARLSKSAFAKLGLPKEPAAPKRSRAQSVKNPVAQPAPSASPTAFKTAFSQLKDTLRAAEHRRLQAADVAPIDPKAWVEVVLENVVIVPKERQRFGNGFVYTSKRTRAFERTLAEAGIKAMGLRPLMEGPTEAEITIFFPIPKSWPKEAQEEARAGLRLPTRRFDVDNGTKAVLDSLNEIVYPDDSQVVELQVRKIYADQPGMIAKFRPVLNKLGGWKK